MKFKKFIINLSIIASAFAFTQCAEPPVASTKPITAQWTLDKYQLGACNPNGPNAKVSGQVTITFLAHKGGGKIEQFGNNKPQSFSFTWDSPKKPINVEMPESGAAGVLIKVQTDCNECGKFYTTDKHCYFPGSINYMGARVNYQKEYIWEGTEIPRFLDIELKQENATCCD